MNRKKKNLTIILIAVLNLVLTIVAWFYEKKDIPLKIFESDTISKLCSRNALFILPAIVIVISIAQVIYRIHTMDKPVTTGKLIEDGCFAFFDGLLICVNWVLVYIGLQFTNTAIITIDIPFMYIIMGLLGLVLSGIYSTFPINKKGSLLGLVTKETVADDEVWRIANRFNGFTGFVSSIIIVLMAAYYIINGFNLIYFIIEVFICFMLMFYFPRLNAKRVADKKAQRVVE